MEEDDARGGGGAGCRGIDQVDAGYQVCFDTGACHSTAVLDAELRGAARERRDAGATGMSFKAFSFSVSLPRFGCTRPPTMVEMLGAGRKGQREG